MKEALSYKGNIIRLTEERWIHITSSHPEMAFLLEEVLNTINDPDSVFKGDFGESISVKKINDKYLVVPYKEEKDGFIITAYITKKLRGREIIWEAKK